MAHRFETNPKAVAGATRTPKRFARNGARFLHLDAGHVAAQVLALERFHLLTPGARGGQIVPLLQSSTQTSRTTLPGSERTFGLGQLSESIGQLKLSRHDSASGTNRTIFSYGSICIDPR